LSPVGGDDTNILLGKVLGPLEPEAKDAAMLGNIRRLIEEIIKIASKDVCPKILSCLKECMKKI